jgi:hypothetical protein
LRFVPQPLAAGETTVERGISQSFGGDRIEIAETLTEKLVYAIWRPVRRSHDLALGEGPLEVEHQSTRPIIAKIKSRFPAFWKKNAIDNSHCDLPANRLRNHEALLLP